MKKILLISSLFVMSSSLLNAVDLSDVKTNNLTLIKGKNQQVVYQGYLDTKLLMSSDEVGNFKSNTGDRKAVPSKFKKNIDMDTPQNIKNNDNKENNDDFDEDFEEPEF